jgi:hypothetical protein
LIACLKQQAEQFRLFLVLLARQRDALVERDTERIEQIIAEQERAIALSRQIEQRRCALTARLTRFEPRGEQTPTLTRIAELVAASDASQLRQMQELLSGLQQEIDRRKKLNATLIEQSVRCTGETLQWIARSVRPQPVYGGQGRCVSGGSGQIAVNRHC